MTAAIAIWLIRETHWQLLQLESINISLIHKTHYNTQLEIFMLQVVLTTMYEC